MTSCTWSLISMFGTRMCGQTIAIYSNSERRYLYSSSSLKITSLMRSKWCRQFWGRRILWNKSSSALWIKSETPCSDSNLRHFRLVILFPIKLQCHWHYFLETCTFSNLGLDRRDKRAGRSISQSINLSINQSVDRSIDQSVNQTYKQTNRFFLKWPK